MSLIEKFRETALSKFISAGGSGGGAIQLSLPQIQATGGSQYIQNADPGTFFPVLQPIRTLAPKESRPWQYNRPVGANLIWTPKSEGTGQDGIPFAVLRTVSRTWDYLRIALDTAKDVLCSIPWEIRPKQMPGEKQQDYKTRQANDKTLTQLQRFMNKPDGVHTLVDCSRMILEDMMVCDCSTLWMERDLAGRIASVHPMDGTMFAPLLTDQGFQPQYPEPAYYQSAFGLPAWLHTNRDIIYSPRNPSTDRRYGLSDVEAIINTVQLGLMRMSFVKQEYASGNIPEALCFLPPSVSLDRVKETQMWFDSVLAGDLANRRRLRFMPSLGTDEKARPSVVFTKEALLKDELDEWLVKVVGWRVGVSVQAIIKQMNRAASQQSVESSEEEGLAPKAQWLSAQWNLVIEQMGLGDDYEFAYKVRREMDAKIQADIDDIYIQNATVPRNEVRERMGLDPRPEKEMDIPGFMGPQGFIPIEMALMPQPDAAPAPDDGGKKPAKPAPAKVVLTPMQRMAIMKRAHEFAFPYLEFNPKIYAAVKASRFKLLCEAAESGVSKKALKVIPQKASITGGHLTPDSNIARVSMKGHLNQVFIHQRTKAKEKAKELMKGAELELLKSMPAENIGPRAVYKLLCDKHGAVNKSDKSAAWSVADEIYDEINGTWIVLVTQTARELERAGFSGVTKGIVELTIQDGTAIAAANDVARTYAEKRAAEMVGMKITETGNLVQNPNAKWVISDTTRNELRDIITKAFEKETSMNEVIAEIQSAGVFSEARAENIAKTEVIAAQTGGNFAIWKESGVVTTLTSQVSADHTVPDECDLNDDVTVPFGEPFPTGHLHPPYHPGGCQCAVYPGVAEIADASTAA